MIRNSDSLEEGAERPINDAVMNLTPGLKPGYSACQPNPIICS
jgi:hypothetical protein